MTTQTELLREALQAAVQALRPFCDGDIPDGDAPENYVRNAVTATEKALRALAQPEQPAPQQGDMHHWPQQGDTSWPPQAEQRKESVLIDGIAYEIPAEVACELLRLHMELLQPAPQAEPHPPSRLCMCAVDQKAAGEEKSPPATGPAG